ncbi:MAG TPA: hypothetical protein VFD32_15810, partial [Dehalococcoidia bacterium]|nr:hypothetical protein [Dehalococcoidia bacterium]
MTTGESEGTAAAVAPPEDPVAKLFGDLFPSLIKDAGKNAMGETTFSVPREEVAFLLRQARERPELGFDFLRCLTGIDQEAEGIEI